MATTDRESFSSQAALEVLAALRQIAESHSEDPGSSLAFCLRYGLMGRAKPTLTHSPTPHCCPCPWV